MIPQPQQEGPVFEKPKIPRAYCERILIGKKCIYSLSEYYACQSDTGFNYFCNHPSVGKKMTPAHYGETPDWCPCSRPAPSRNILDTDLCVCGLTEMECKAKEATIRNQTLGELEILINDEMKPLTKKPTMNNREIAFRWVLKRIESLRPDPSAPTDEQCPHWICIDHSDGDEWCCNRPPIPSAPTDEQCRICSAAICNQMLDELKNAFRIADEDSCGSPWTKLQIIKLIDEYQESLRREVPE